MIRPATLLLCLVAASAGTVAANAEALGPAAVTSTVYDELPAGDATTLPWWQRGQLHLGTTVISTRLSDIDSRHGTTVVAASADRRRGGVGTWFLVDGDQLRQLPMQTKTDKPLLSANGHWLAWLEVRAPRTTAYRRVERYRVVLYDVRRHRIANRFRDRRLVEWEDGINGIWLRTLSNDGRLVLSQGSDGVRVLSPQGRPRRFRGPQVGNGAGVDGWPRGTTVLRSWAGRSVYGSVARGGGFERAGSFTVSFSGLWAPHGRRYAYTDYDSPTTTSWVRTLDGESVQLDVPTDVPEFRIVGWESADAVLLWQFDRYSSQPSSRLIRCAPTTGACERVPDGPGAGSPATMPSR